MTLSLKNIAWMVSLLGAGWYCYLYFAIVDGLLTDLGARKSRARFWQVAHFENIGEYCRLLESRGHHARARYVKVRIWIAVTMFAAGACVYLYKVFLVGGQG